jgi:dTDP-4-dehydrorhamnose reductase
MIQMHSPDLIVNAAAYTAVDKAEEDVETAYSVNVDAPRLIASECERHNVSLVHISTDYVFDGAFKRPYTETDRPNPQSIYGKTKLGGELAVQMFCKKSVVVRTSWVFSEYGNNFVKTMLRLAREGGKIKVIADQIGSPTCAWDLAEAIVQCIQLEREGNLQYDLYHYCGDSGVSWYDFAKTIFKVALEEGTIRDMPIIQPVKTIDYHQKARRPMYSVLSCRKIEEKLNIRPSSWQISLRNVILNI